MEGLGGGLGVHVLDFLRSFFLFNDYFVVQLVDVHYHFLLASRVSLFDAEFAENRVAGTVEADEPGFAILVFRAISIHL